MRITSGDVSLEVQVEGDQQGIPVVLLHGWPDSSDLWRHQRAALGAAGFRVVTPDLRGFGASDKPEAVDAYWLAHHLADMTTVLDHLDIDRAHFVGHDWGGVVSWIVASLAPDRVRSLVSMSMGHPNAMRIAGREQLGRFWYAFLYQFAEPAERWLSRDGWQNLRDWLQHPDHDRVVPVLEAPGALRASMNIYRANLTPEVLIGDGPDVPAVSAPTMAIWGSSDPSISEAWVRASEQFVTGSWRFERIDAGHWVQLDKPDVTSELLLDFLSSQAATGTSSTTSTAASG